MKSCPTNKTFYESAMISPCYALSKSLKTFGFRSFFIKWLHPHVLAVLIATKSYASIRFVPICPLTHMHIPGYFLAKMHLIIYYDTSVKS